MVQLDIIAGQLRYIFVGINSIRRKGVFIEGVFLNAEVDEAVLS